PCVEPSGRSPTRYTQAIELGLAGETGNAWLLAACPVSAALLHRWVLREERWLRAAFGDDYDATLPTSHATCEPQAPSVVSASGPRLLHSRTPASRRTS